MKKFHIVKTNKQYKLRNMFAFRLAYIKDSEVRCKHFATRDEANKAFRILKKKQLPIIASTYSLVSDIFTRTTGFVSAAKEYNMPNDFYDDCENPELNPEKLIVDITFNKNYEQIRKIEEQQIGLINIKILYSESLKVWKLTYDGYGIYSHYTAIVGKTTCAVL